MRNYVHTALILLVVVLMSAIIPTAKAEAAQEQIGIAPNDNNEVTQKAAATSPTVSPDDRDRGCHHNHNHDASAEPSDKYKQTVSAKTKPPPNLDWMLGRSRLVISMVLNGRLDINNLPPKGQDHFIYPQFEDVVHADVMAVPDGSDEVQTMTYRDVYGRERTKEEYDRYRENEEKMEKPYKGQLKHLFA